MSKQVRRVLIALFLLGWNIMLPAQEGTIGEIKILFDYQQGIKINVYDVLVRGMKNRQVHFSFWVAQNGKWLDSTGIELKPQTAQYETTVWAGEAFWFTYTYELLRKQGLADKEYWGSFFIMDTANNTMIGRKDISFSLPGTGKERKTDLPDKDTPTTYFNDDTSAYPVQLADDFSSDRLTDNTRYARFGPAYFKVVDGVLRAAWDEKRLEFMELINIFPCFGKKSMLSFDLRWAGGEGGNLLVAADFRYRMVGRRTHLYFNLNENKLTAWNTNGYDARDLAVQKNQWLHVKIERTETSISVYIDNNKILEKKPDKLDPIHNDSQEANYSGYAFETDIRPYPQVIEIDNLKIAGEQSPVQFSTLTEQFYVNKKVDPQPYRFTVLYEQEYEPWAKGQLAVSIPYIKTLADVLGIPALSHGLGMVQNRGKYFDGGAGYNNRGVVYQAANNNNVHWLNSHELAHDWYNYYGKKWSIEGSADFCYFAYTEVTKKKLMLATDFLFNREKIGKETMLKAVKNFYLEDEESTKDFFKGGMPDFDLIHSMAWKQRVFIYMLYRLLGPQGFRDFHKQAVRLDHGMNSGELQSFAEIAAGRDLSSYFKGWIFPGRSILPAEEVFADDDGDGLSNLDEALFGTDPEQADTDGDHYTDYGEIAYGSHPLNPQVPAGKPVIVDGNFEDWNNVPVAAEDSQDAKGGEDIKSVQTIIDKKNRIFLGRVLFWQPAQISANSAADSCYLTFDFDTDRDTQADYRLNIFFDRKQSYNFFKTNGYTGEKWDPAQWTGLPGDGVEYVYKDGDLELLLPIEIIGSPDSCAVYICSGTAAGTDWFDKSPVLVKGIGTYSKRPEQIWQPGK